MNLSEYFEYIKNKKIALIGLGVSHKPLVKLFKSKGAEVTVLDKKSRNQLGGDADYVENLGGKLLLSEDYLKNLSEYDIVFRTPGMKYYTKELQDAKKKGVEITSEMETFFELCPCKIIGVTGSDGKSTSTGIIAEILKAEGKTVHLGGNIGWPLLPVIEKIGQNDVVVAELSSFQLISMKKSPNISLVTNLSPNHLDMHKDMDEYIGAKKNIFKYQSASDKLILNYDNEITKGFASEAKSKVCFFSRREKLKDGVFLEDGCIKCQKENKIFSVININEIKIPGIHNVENYMGAIAAVIDDVSVESIAIVARNFSGIEHRIEFVREIDGVKYYNDSIATSPTRTIAGLNSFNKKIIIIAGGYDKNISYEPLAPVIIKKVKSLILLGKTAEKIKKSVTLSSGYSKGNPDIYNVNTLEEAVAKAKEIAEKGDIVSLSPASASFDLYKNFEERGRHFKNIINTL